MVKELEEVGVRAGVHGGVRDVAGASGAGSVAGMGQGVDGVLLVFNSVIHGLEVLLEDVNLFVMFGDGGLFSLDEGVDVVLCLIVLILEGGLVCFGGGVSGAEAGE